MAIGDQVGAAPDGDRAGVVPAERVVAGAGVEQLGGRPVPALLGGEPLVELDGAHLLEQVDHGVAVADPSVSRAAGVVQRAARPDAVAEVALGGGAEADVRPGLADQPRRRRR